MGPPDFNRIKGNLDYLKVLFSDPIKCMLLFGGHSQHFLDAHTVSLLKQGITLIIVYVESGFMHLSGL